MTDTAATIAADVIASLQAEGIASRFTLVQYDTANEYEGVCTPADAAYRHMKGTVIEERHRVFDVYGLSVAPTTADEARIYGGTDDWSIKEVHPLDFGEQAYAYRVKVGN